MEWSVVVPNDSYVYNVIASYKDNAEELCNNAKLVSKLIPELDSTIVYYKGVILQNLSFEFYKNDENDAYKTRYPFYITEPVGLTQFSYSYQFPNCNFEFIPTNEPKAQFIAMFYEDLSGKNLITINDTIHIKGFYQHQCDNKLPIIHVFAYKIANYNIIPPLEISKSDYQSLVSFVSSSIGDELMAEYIILLLGMTQIGDNKPLSLLVTTSGTKFDENLIKTLQYLVEYVKYIDNYNVKLYSKMDYDQTPEILVPGQLQLGKGAAVILNLDNLPVELEDYVDNLLNGKVVYHFGPSLYQIKANLRTILTTDNEDSKYLHKTSLRIKYLPNVTTKIITPSDYKFIQLIDKAWASPMQIDIPNEIEQLMIDSWAKFRNVASIEDFNNWVSFSRTLCYLQGDDSISAHHWNHVLALESKRRDRNS